MRQACGFALTAAFAGLVSGGARQAAPRVDAAGAVAAVAGTPAVAQALTLVQRDDALTLDDQVAVCEVPAPPFKEARRA
jgi:hypothetical protein